MAASKVMALRIEPELLEQLRAAAKEERRSVSGQMVYLVRKGLSAPRKPRRPLPTRGWLRHLKAPGALEEFHAVRRFLSRSLEARSSRRSKAT